MKNHEKDTLQYNEVYLCYCKKKYIDLKTIKKWLLEKNLNNLLKDEYIIKISLILIKLLEKINLFNNLNNIKKILNYYCNNCKNKIEEIDVQKDDIKQIIVIIGIILIKISFNNYFFYNNLYLNGNNNNNMHVDNGNNNNELINELLELCKNCICNKRLELEEDNLNNNIINNDNLINNIKNDNSDIYFEINNFICLIILFSEMNIYLCNYDDAYIGLDYIAKKYPNIEILILCLKKSIRIILSLENDEYNKEDNHLFYSKKYIYYTNIIHCFIRSILLLNGIDLNKSPNDYIIINNNINKSIYNECKLLLQEFDDLDIIYNNFEINYTLSRLYFEIDNNIDKSIEIMEKLINKCNFNNIYRIYFGKLLSYKAIVIKNKEKNLKLIKTLLKKAISYIPNSSDLYNDLGIIYYELGKKDKVIWCFELSIYFNPMNINTYNNIGIFFRKSGYIKESIKCYEKIIELNPNCVNSLNIIATLYNTIGHIDTSLNYFKKCINMNNNIADMYNNLGVLYRDCGNFLYAKYCFLISIELNNNNLLAFQNLLYILNYFIPIKYDKIKDSLRYYNKDIIINNILEDEINPCLNIIDDNNIYNDKYYIYDDELYDISYEWGNKLIYMNKDIKDELDNNMPITNIPDLHASDCMHIINIGFLGAEFFHHAVAFFTYAPIKYLSNYILKEELLDKNIEIKFNIFIYDNSPHHDYYTKDFKDLISLDNWRYIYEKDNVYVSKLIRNDKIHVLFDLSGHTLNNRMDVFVLKNSPIQISWIGYPNTSGLKYIDYRITDKYSDPINNKQKYSEKLIYLNNCFLCYTIPRIEYPLINDLPYNKNGYITFGSFNRITKLHPIIIDIWCRILKNISDSHLILKSKAFNSEICKKHYYDLFDKKYGIKKDRILLLSLNSSYYSHLDMYNMIDISLDTFPYAGTTTTFECIFMGVPLITLSIENDTNSQIFDQNLGFDISSFHSQNVGKSILSNLNMHDLIASTKDQFINAAINLAKDIEKLKYYRSNLRDILMKSKLCDGENFSLELAQLIVKTLRNHNSNT